VPSYPSTGVVDPSLSTPAFMPPVEGVK